MEKVEEAGRGKEWALIKERIRKILNKKRRKASKKKVNVGRKENKVRTLSIQRPIGFSV